VQGHYYWLALIPAVADFVVKNYQADTAASARAWFENAIR